MAAASFQETSLQQSTSRESSDKIVHDESKEFALLVRRLEKVCSAEDWLSFAESPAGNNDFVTQYCQRHIEAALQTVSENSLNRNTFKAAAKKLFVSRTEVAPDSRCKECSARVAGIRLCMQGVRGDDGLDADVQEELGTSPQPFVQPKEYKNLKSFSFDPVQSEPIVFEELSFDEEQYTKCTLF